MDQAPAETCTNSQAELSGEAEVKVEVPEEEEFWKNGEDIDGGEDGGICHKNREDGSHEDSPKAPVLLLKPLLLPLRVHGKRCFICYKRAKALQVKELGKSRRVIVSELEESCHAVFLLSKLLEIPGYELRKYLERGGGTSPNEWIGLCHECQPFVREALEVNRKVVKLLVELRTCRDKIIEKIKKSSSAVRILNGNTNCGRIDVTVEARKYVITKKYTSSNPFVEGDKLAEALLPPKEDPHPEPVPERENKCKIKDLEECAVVVVTPFSRLKPKLYTCQSCPGLDGMNLKAFICHMMFHRNRPLKCAECPAYLPNDDKSIRIHWQKLHPAFSSIPKYAQAEFTFGNVWECFGCKESFPSDEERDSHEKKIHGTSRHDIEAPHSCSPCSKSFHNLEEWRLHRAIEHPSVEEFGCLYCDESFQMATKEGLFVCDIMGFRRHLKTSHKSLPNEILEACDDCGQVVPLTYHGRELALHLIDKHGGSESHPFSCRICEQPTGYADRRHLTRHVQLFHCQMVHSCELCLWRCQLKSDLARHRISEHGMKPGQRVEHKCPFENCSFTTENKFTFWNHSRTHSHEDGAFSCPLCGQKFKRQNLVESHQRGYRCPAKNFVPKKKRKRINAALQQLIPDKLSVGNGANVFSTPKLSNTEPVQALRRSPRQSQRISHRKRYLEESENEDSCSPEPEEDDDGDAFDPTFATSDGDGGSGSDGEIHSNSVKITTTTSSCHTSASRNDSSTHEKQQQKSESRILFSSYKRHKFYDQSWKRPRGQRGRPKKVNVKLEPAAEPIPFVETPFNIHKRQSYSCTACPHLSNMSFSAFICHLNFHLTRPYKCTKCSAHLPEDASSVERHWEEFHYDDSPDDHPKHVLLNFEMGSLWECFKCEETFSSDEERNRHEESQHKTSRQDFEAIHPCSSCSKSFHNLEEWRLHRTIEHQAVNQIACIYCDETFAFKTEEKCDILDVTSLSKHVKEKHNSLQRSLYEACDFCGQVFPASYMGHYLAEHLKGKHGLGEKYLFNCKICSRSCNNREKLSIHIRHVHGVLKHVCEVCGWKGTMKFRLNCHKFNQHGIQPEDCKLYKCTVDGCDFETPRLASFGEHLKAHRDPVSRMRKNFQCQFCRKWFMKFVALTNHRKICSTKRPKKHVAAARIQVKLERAKIPDRVTPPARDPALTDNLSMSVNDGEDDIQQDYSGDFSSPPNSPHTPDLLPDDEDEEKLEEELVSITSAKPSQSPKLKNSKKRKRPKKLTSRKKTTKKTFKVKEVSTATPQNFPFTSVLKRKSFTCPSCPSLGEMTFAPFMAHLMFHISRPVKCLECSLFLEGEQALDKHWDECHPKCETFPRQCRVDVNPGNCWECSTCEATFPSNDERDLHELEVHQLSRQDIEHALSCSFCSTQFRSFEEWRLHRVLKHPNVEELACGYCDQLFAWKTNEGIELSDTVALKKHLKESHPTLIQALCETCSFCGQVFPLTYYAPELIKHSQDKHGFGVDKIFVCKVCNKGCLNRYNVRSHTKSVHGERKFVCELCGHKSKVEFDLECHKFNEHAIHSEKYKVYKCPQEGCSFETLRAQCLTSHSKSHIEARPFMCGFCGQSFKASSDMKYHEKVHLNAKTKPFQCEICGNSFAVRKYLYIHKRLSHQGRFFPSSFKKKTRGNTSPAKKRKRVEPVSPPPSPTPE